MPQTAIGGFIELDIASKPCPKRFQQGIFLNSGRNALRYAIRLWHIQRLWVPFYTCPVIWQAVRAEHCTLLPYAIDSDFLPLAEIDETDFVLYVDYFGICAQQTQKMTQKFPHLLLDCAMSFYAQPKALANFYSPRKFFGLPDGGIFISHTHPLNRSADFPQDLSFSRFSHLIKRIETGAQCAYADFNQNDDSLLNAPILKMSLLTQKLLFAQNFHQAAQRRVRNFLFLAKALNPYNQLSIPPLKNAPMYYPFVHEKAPQIRRALLKENIFCPQPWRNLDSLLGKQPCEWERYFYHHLIPLIIDQRYFPEDLEPMRLIVENFC